MLTLLRTLIFWDKSLYACSMPCVIVPSCFTGGGDVLDVVCIWGKRFATQIREEIRAARTET